MRGPDILLWWHIIICQWWILILYILTWLSGSITRKDRRAYNATFELSVDVVIDIYIYIICSMSVIGAGDGRMNLRSMSPPPPLVKFIFVGDIIIIYLKPQDITHDRLWLCREDEYRLRRYWCRSRDAMIHQREGWGVLFLECVVERGHGNGVEWSDLDLPIAQITGIEVTYS